MPANQKGSKPEKRKSIPRLVIENARLLFRNFNGAANKYNAQGNRNTSVVIPEADAKQLLADGWNVRQLPPKEDGDRPLYFIQVRLSYDKQKPMVVLITSTGLQQPLSEESVGLLDYAEIEKVDISINPFSWDLNGKSGVKGYIHSLYVTLKPDPLADKYRLPQAN